MNCRNLWRAVSVIRLKPQCLELVSVGLWTLFGQQFFDLDRQIIEVTIAYDWVHKLRTCTISEEEGQFIFVLAGKRRSEGMLLRLALALELFKELYLAPELAASFRGFWQPCLWVGQILSGESVSLHDR